jgi:hypothetical protein
LAATASKKPSDAKQRAGSGFLGLAAQELRRRLGSAALDIQPHEAFHWTKPIK